MAKKKGGKKKGGKKKAGGKKENPALVGRVTGSLGNACCGT